MTRSCIALLAAASAWGSVSVALAGDCVKFVDATALRLVASAYSVIAAQCTQVVVEDHIEGDVSGWTIVNAPSLTTGAWVAVDPVGTLNLGMWVQLPNDATPGAGTICWVTGQAIAEPASQSDVDSGPTQLMSPPVDLGGDDAIVTYSISMYCDDLGFPSADVLSVEVSGDGGASWTLVETIVSTGGSWASHSFIVGDFVEIAGPVRVRFGIEDVPNNSVTDAGIDDFVVERIVCDATCLGDLDRSGAVDGADLGALLSAWGAAGPADLDGSGVVDGGDLGALLAAWGGCG